MSLCAMCRAKFKYCQHNGLYTILIGTKTRRELSVWRGFCEQLLSSACGAKKLKKLNKIRALVRMVISKKYNNKKY